MLRRVRSFAAATLALLLLTGCAVHFIAPYDAVLDSSMTAVQADTELFFDRATENASTGAVTYAQCVDFYQRTEATLHTLELRARMVPKSDRVANQIHNVQATVVSMQATHRVQNNLSLTYLETERGLLDSEFRSFFALELSLKNHFNKPLAAQTAPALPGSVAGENK